MTNVLIIFVILFVINTVLSLTFFKLYKRCKNNYEKEHNKLVGLEAEYTRLVEAYQIQKNNKEEADEKIDDLHSGVISADDILPKR